MLLVLIAIVVVALFYRTAPQQAPVQPKIMLFQQPPAPEPRTHITQLLRPDIYPEPVLRNGQPRFADSRSINTPYQQIGILTAQGGSSSSASPDRTILPLYGRELDPRRSRWNYYTRTDGSNPVQVPVRVGNRVCDDDTNGCNELFSNDSVNVPALGRSFTATVYRKSIYG